MRRSRDRLESISDAAGGTEPGPAGPACVLGPPNLPAHIQQATHSLAGGQGGGRDDGGEDGGHTVEEGAPAPAAPADDQSAAVL